MPDSKTCKTCRSPLIVRKTKPSANNAQKAYYYTAYYYCPRCQKMYLSDEFKVENKQSGLFATPLEGPIDVEIWTDGACSNNGKPHAKAAWAFVAGEVEKAGLVEGKQTNNTAESLAVYEALKWAGEQGHKKVKLYSDSQITLFNMFKGLENIKVNKDIFAKIFAVIDRHQLQVQFEKVLGHSGNPNNERADKLANTLAGVK